MTELAELIWREKYQDIADNLLQRLRATNDSAEMARITAAIDELWDAYRAERG